MKQVFYSCFGRTDNIYLNCLQLQKKKTFVAMVMKDRYWHKSPEEMINVSLKYISKIPPGKANTDFINFYQQTNRNLMRYIL